MALTPKSIQAHPGLIEAEGAPRPEGEGRVEHARVLLVDDEVPVLRAIERLLRHMGYAVQTAKSAAAALSLVGEQPFDVIITDIAMPGMDGLQLLHALRTLETDIPVVLTTGGPTIESAVHAVELGALRYLTKPIKTTDLSAALESALAARREWVQQRWARRLLKEAAEREKRCRERAGQLEKAVTKLWIAFQPIVSWRDRCISAYEALVRSDERSMANPAALLEAADELGRLPDLGQAIRRLAAESVSGLPRGADLFVNLHPTDLLDPDLYDSQAPLSRLASRVVLEVTERESLEGIDALQERLASLRRLGFRIAVDDLGAGYASLAAVAVLRPDIIKIDMTLVRDIDSDATKAEMVRGMVELSHRLGLTTVAEGVETGSELERVCEVGADLVQGFLFAKPARGFEQVDFSGINAKG